MSRPQAYSGSVVLVTGAAGFIGFHASRRLLESGASVIGFDNLNDYYDPSLKASRLEQLVRYPGFRFESSDLTDNDAVDACFERYRPTRVLHFAAQPGVRYSLTNPTSYTASNVTGLLSVLEGCRRHEVQHLVFASTSSVYGANTRLPYSEHSSVDHPVSLYAATKRSGELMAHCYSHLYGIPCTCLRYFTVYGPWGRPDMAYYSFTRKILAGEPIDVFGEGQHKRSFTYVDDVVEGTLRILEQPATPDPAWDADAPVPSRSDAPFRIYNIGNPETVELARFIEILEKALGCTAKKNFIARQPGDVLATSADIAGLSAAVGYAPHTPLVTGIERFVEWYREYHGKS